MFKKTPRLMSEAAAAEAGAASGGAADAGAPAAPAPASAPVAPPAPAGTVMAKGAPAAEPAAWSAPDKYLVKNGDEVDWQATARKIDEGRSHLERRFGAGDVPPKDVADYKVAAPEQYAELLKDWNPAEDQALQSFLGNAHKAGFTQQQLDLVLGEYGRVMSQVQGAQLTPEQRFEQEADATAKALGEVWKEPGEFDKNVGLSYQAGVKLAAKIGVDYDEFNAALGNNAMFLRVAAALAPEMQEDTPAGTQQTPSDALDWEAKRADLVSQRDALKEGDPRRAQIVKQLKDHYERKYQS